MTISSVAHLSLGVVVFPLYLSLSYLPASLKSMLLLFMSSKYNIHATLAFFLSLVDHLPKTPRTGQEMCLLYRLVQ